MKRPGVRIVVGFALALCTSCDSDPDAFPPEEECPTFDYSGFDGQSPSVSFSADVLPIFAQNCTETGCHGNAATPASGLFLGPSPEAAEFPASEETRRNIIDVYLVAPARTTPDKARVAPGEPARSFLLDKLDGSHACIDVSCPGNNCGQRMPRGHDQLPADVRDTIRRWIAQGARAD